MIEYTNVRPDKETVLSNIETLLTYFKDIKEHITASMGMTLQTVLNNDISYAEHTLSNAKLFLSQLDDPRESEDKETLDFLVCNIFLDYTHALLMLKYNYYENQQIKSDKISRTDNNIIGNIITMFMFIISDRDGDINEIFWILKHRNALIMKEYGIKIPENLLPMLVAHCLKN